MVGIFFQEQKPDSNPSDSNTEYIKLKVVGNVSLYKYFSQAEYYHNYLYLCYIDTVEI